MWRLALLALLWACSSGARDTPGHIEPLGGCHCYATAALTFDGGLCVRASPLCPEVCTCETVPPCRVESRPFFCVGEDPWEQN